MDSELLDPISTPGERLSSYIGLLVALLLVHADIYPSEMSHWLPVEARRMLRVASETCGSQSGLAPFANGNQ
jgi:hypothetical protein